MRRLMEVERTILHIIIARIRPFSNITNVMNIVSKRDKDTVPRHSCSVTFWRKSTGSGTGR